MCSHVNRLDVNLATKRFITALVINLSYKLDIMFALQANRDKLATKSLHIRAATNILLT